MIRLFSSTDADKIYLFGGHFSEFMKTSIWREVFFTIINFMRRLLYGFGSFHRTAVFFHEL